MSQVHEITTPNGYERFVPEALYLACLKERSDLAAELAETQRQLKLVAPVGRYNGRNIEEWANYGAALEAALHAAIECVGSWGAYASEYFQDKHDLAGDIARLKAVILGSTPETVAECQHDKSKPNPTLQWLGSSTPSGANTHLWRCTVCGHQFDLPAAFALKTGGDVK